MGNVADGSFATTGEDGPKPRLLEQFRQAWEAALAQVSPPDIDSFLRSSGNEDSVADIEQLRAIDADFRRRLGRTPGERTESGRSEDTVTAASAVAPSERSLSRSLADANPLEPTALWPHAVEPKPNGSNLDTPHAVGATVSGDRPSPHGSRSGSAIPISLQHVAGYELLDLLGRGGMGVVYRARQTGLNRLVALKTMLTNHGQADPEYLARFRAEAKAVAQLQHPNVVQIYEIGVQQGLPFLALELVEGASLEAERAGQPMLPQRAAALVETLARAMQYAHDRGIVHRDLKPANVLLTRDGVPKITDFGLVKRLTEDSGQTRTGTIIGTPGYMSPEQAQGSKDVGPLSDVYSLGAVLYALLTGRPPFLAPTPLETVMQVMQQEPVPPSSLQPNLPRDLETICLKCLQKDPGRRYATATDLADDLRRFQAGEAILARPVGRAERLWRWCRRKPALAASVGIAAVLALCLLIGGPVATLRIDRERAAVIAALGLAQENGRQADRNAAVARDQRDLAVTALNTLVQRVPTELKNIPGTDEIKRDVLLTAMTGLTKIEQAGGEQSKDMVLATAHAKLGEVLLEVGETEPAEKQFRRCHEILLEVAQREPQTPRYIQLLRLGRSYRNLGRAAERRQGAKAAKEFYLQSLKVRKESLPLSNDPAFIKQEIAEVSRELGRMCLLLGRPHEATDYIAQEIAYRQEWLQREPENERALRAQAGARLTLGHQLRNLGEPRKSVEHYRAALGHYEKLAARERPEFMNREMVALCHDFLGTAHLFAGDASAAQKEFALAVEQLEAICRENPRHALLRRKLAKVHYGLGASYQQLNDPAAKRHLARSVELRQEVFNKSPNDLGTQQELMVALARNGQIDETVQLAEKILSHSAQSADALFNVACAYALCAAAMTGAEKRDGEPAVVQSKGAFRKQAVATLKRAVEQGYEAIAVLRTDPDLAALQSDSDFQRLLQEIKPQTGAGEK